MSISSAMRKYKHPIYGVECNFVLHVWFFYILDYYVPSYRAVEFNTSIYIMRIDTMKSCAIDINRTAK